MESMNRSSRSLWLHLRTVGLVAIFGTAAALLLWSGQLAAVVLLPLVLVLLRTLEARDRRAQALAQRIADAGQTEKVEVHDGAWGELARAINMLLHERLVGQRMRDALPAPLPLEAVQSLLGGELATDGRARRVAVLLISAPVRAPAWEQGVRRAGMTAWQALANAAQDGAQQYGALLQPCGDAVMLVFGAFDERPLAAALRDAQAAAAQIEQGWRAGFPGGAPLALALAGGYALAAALPGLGFCVVGTPVEQAVGLQQLALRSRRFGLMCSEEAYQALRRDPGAAWHATDLRVAQANRPPQVVYRWGGAP